MVLALATGGVMIAAGVDIWLVLGVMLVWCASFWLMTAPPAPPPRERPEGVQLTRTGMRDLIEHSGLPMLMLDGERIIVANAAARETIGAHVVGQDARVALRHPVAVDLLSRPGGGSATIQGLTGPRSNWQMSRQPLDKRYSLIELINRTAEADVSRAHTDFVANASHELKTPLASLSGFIETLQGHAKDDPEAQARFLGIMGEQAARMQRLIEDLLSLSRIEMREHVPPSGEVDLPALVSDVVDGLSPLAESYGVEINVTRGEGVQPVWGDWDELHQVVQNLAENALKYGRAGKRIDISTKPVTSPSGRTLVELVIRDYGPGIPREHIPRLTERFYRVDVSKSRERGGTGLGLAIVKHIVNRHSGTLSIDSQVGEGSTFSVRLPVRPIRPDAA